MTLEELLQRRAALMADLREVNVAIETHKVKCPTCRCRILPGRECTCCAYSNPYDPEPAI